MKYLLLPALAVSYRPHDSIKFSHHDFHKLLSTEAENEFHPNNPNASFLWNQAADHEWEKSESLQRRHLQQVDSNPSDFSTPFVVCSSLANSQGFHRKLEIEEHFKPKKAFPLYNKDDKSCYSIHATHSTATAAPASLTVHPFTPSMKLPKNSLSSIVKDVTNNAESLQMNLCKTHAITYESRVQFSNKLSQEVKNLFEEDSSSHRTLVESDLHQHTSNNLFSGILSSNTSECAKQLEHLRFAAAKEFEYVYVDGVSLAFSSPVHHDNCLISLVAFLATRNEVCSLSPKPRMQLKNAEAQWIVQSGSPNSRPFWDAGVTGEGQVVQCSDSGLDQDNCYFYDNSGDVTTSTYTNYYLDQQHTASSKRKVIQYNAFHNDARDDDGGHGTHVVGSIVGHKSPSGSSGGESDGYASGIAKDAKVAFFDLGVTGAGGLSTPTDVSSLFTPGRVSAGANLHSASWGSTGANYQESDANFDAYQYAHPDFLVLVAAGNDGWNYFCQSPAGQAVDQNLDAPYGCNSENYVVGNSLAGSLGSPANAKNVISVGATESYGNDIMSSQRGINYIADFSSRGPTADGRTKPDLLAPGFSILSASGIHSQTAECDPTSKPDAPNGDVQGLKFMAGTSMATPVMSGTAALVRQYFSDGYYPTGGKVGANALNPKASLVKAVLLNSGQPMDGSNNQGGQGTTDTAMYDSNENFGRVNLLKTLRLSGQNTISTFAVYDTVTASGASRTKVFDFTINNSGCSADDLSVTLVWTDPDISANCNNCVVNDLDLKIVKGATTTYPNGRTSRDSTNNAERIRIDNPEDGSKYTATVTATNLDTSAQGFSLVSSGCFSEAEDTSGTARPSAAPTNEPSRAPSGAPSSAPTMPDGHTASPTVPQPTAFPSSAPTSPDPLPEEFCEVSIQFQNLKIVDDENVGADQWDDSHTEMFQRSVHALNVTYIPSPDWVCYVTAGVAVDAVSDGDPPSGGLGERLLRKLPMQLQLQLQLQRILQNRYVGISVDFIVSAPFVKNSDTCNDNNAEFVAFANQFYEEMAAKLSSNGGLQSELQKHGSDDGGQSHWLSNVAVKTDEMLVIVDVNNGKTVEDRRCTNWERNQWIQQNRNMIITVGAGLLCACCFCGILLAVRKKKKSRETRRGGGKKYKANIEMHNHHKGHSPFHKGGGGGKGGVGSAATRMNATGFQGQKTTGKASGMASATGKANSNRGAARTSAPPKPKKKNEPKKKNGGGYTGGGYY